MLLVFKVFFFILLGLIILLSFPLLRVTILAIVLFFSLKLFLFDVLKLLADLILEVLLVFLFFNALALLVLDLL